MAFLEGFRNWWEQSKSPIPTEAQLRAEALVRLAHNPPETYVQHVYDDKFKSLVAGLGDVATEHTIDDN